MRVVCVKGIVLAYGRAVPAAGVTLDTGQAFPQMHTSSPSSSSSSKGRPTVPERSPHHPVHAHDGCRVPPWVPDSVARCALRLRACSGRSPRSGRRTLDVQAHHVPFDRACMECNVVRGVTSGRRKTQAGDLFEKFGFMFTHFVLSCDASSTGSDRYDRSSSSP